MNNFGKPENALKLAEELIAVGQKPQALQTLQDVILSRRYRTWSKTLETIMLKNIELCVELKKGKLAKETLHQYKIVSHMVNVSSLEVVVKHYLKLSEDCAKDAQSKAEKITLDVEDLEAEESAESLILSAVSGEDIKNRTDREIVTPWLKLLWETYRTILEVLRNHAKLETLYHDTARQAFSFCHRYQRKTEFRRLCDILRQHLSNLGKYPNQPQSISLNVPETFLNQLETRFAQLNTATDLELWQEAFKSIEDIHGLVMLPQKSPVKPTLMAVYYQKLAQIFWVSKNYLFHAFAWSRYYHIVKNQLKNKTPEELTVLASSVLLAALSIPLQEPSSTEQSFEYDIQKEKNMRLVTLLGFTGTPKREGLLQDLISKKILTSVLPELQDIYPLLEKKFHPLQLCKMMASKLEFIAANDNLKQYGKPLEKITFFRLMQQLSHVYDSMKISEFSRLLSFMSFYEAEKLIVDAVKRRFIVVRIDHQSAALHFGNNILDSEQMKDQISQLARSLQEVVHLVHPKKNEEARKKQKREQYVRIVNSLQDEHKRILARKVIIERKKQYAEEVEEAKRQAIAKKAAEEQHAKDLEDEIARTKAAQERERRRKQEEADRKELDDAEQAIRALGAPSLSSVVKAQQEGGDRARLIEEQMRALNKKNQARIQRLVDLAKSAYHHDRAKRQVEQPLLAERYQASVVEDQAAHVQRVAQHAILHREEHTKSVEIKKRLSRMTDDKNAMVARVMKRRQDEHEVKKKERDARIAAIEARINEERKAKQREIEERKAREEKLRKEEQEREEQRLAADLAKRQERELARKKLEETAEKQRKREEEVMKKAQDEEQARRERERESSSANANPSAGGAWRRQADPVRETPPRSDPYDRPSERPAGAYRPPGSDSRPSPAGDKPGPWRSSSVQQQTRAEPPPSSSGRYVPPSERRASGFDDRRGPDDRRGYDDRRGPDRGYDDRRGGPSGYDDRRGPDRGYDDRRGPEDRRGPDRSYDERDRRGPDRGFEGRGPSSDRGIEPARRGNDDSRDRFERRPDDRNFDRRPEERQPERRQEERAPERRPEERRPEPSGPKDPPRAKSPTKPENPPPSKETPAEEPQEDDGFTTVSSTKKKGRK